MEYLSINTGKAIKGSRMIELVAGFVATVFAGLLAVIAFFIKLGLNRAIHQMELMQGEQVKTTQTLIKISNIQDEVVKQQMRLMKDVTVMKDVLNDHEKRFMGLEIHMNNSVGK